MKSENDEIIDIKGFDVSIDSESIPNRFESIYWFSAAEARHRLKLEKTPFRKVVEELLNIHGIPELAIRRGRARATEYSQTAIALVRALRSGDRVAFDRLKQDLIQPSSVETTALTITEHTPDLDRRIAELNQNSAFTSASLAQDVRETLERIAAQTKASKHRTSGLNNAEIIAAENRGAARALNIYQAEQRARDEILAQLRATELGGGDDLLPRR